MVSTKEKIEQVIKDRIERFNNLWKKAVGYTFEEEPEILQKKYDEVYPVWKEKADARAKELGYESEEAYFKYLWDNHIPFEERDQQMQALWEKAPGKPAPLIEYEMFVIGEAKKFAFWLIDTYGDGLAFAWDRLAKDGGGSSWGIAEQVEKQGFKFDDGHSGNTLSTAVLFAKCLLFEPDTFKYMHGALTPLVGDKGYHDDREDVKVYYEEYKKTHPEAEQEGNKDDE